MMTSIIIPMLVVGILGLVLGGLLGVANLYLKVETKHKGLKKIIVIVNG